MEFEKRRYEYVFKSFEEIQNKELIKLYFLSVNFIDDNIAKVKTSIMDFASEFMDSAHTNLLKGNIEKFENDELEEYLNLTRNTLESYQYTPLLFGTEKKKMNKYYKLRSLNSVSGLES